MVARLPVLRRLLLGIIVLLLSIHGAALQADGPGDNRPEAVRPVPPPGIELSDAQRQPLQRGVEQIRQNWTRLLAASDDAQRPRLTRLEPEILVFPRAVEMALLHGQFHKPAEIQQAADLLLQAQQRIDIAAAGGDVAEVLGLRAAAGEGMLVVGGFRSLLDDSIQPYGLVVPAGYGADDRRPRRLDIWFHGRGETLSEVAFLTQRMQVSGEYAPDDTLVLHPYGRYSNAFRFAGEVDVLEALTHIQETFAVDEDRISVRGFSMGGAACWQFATHYADRWFAANPGAGFSETAEFLDFFQGEDVRGTAPWYQQRLWQLYDNPVWAINLRHCPTIAYSGELDRQKQAADVMQQVLADQGIDLVHVIGPDTAHKIHPQSKLEIEARLRSLAAAGRQTAPQTIDFQTVTLRYHRMHWVDVQGLERHWQPARVHAQIDGPQSVRLESENVTALHLDFAPGQWGGAASGTITVKIDGQELVGPTVRSDRSWHCPLLQAGGRWRIGTPDSAALRKRPGLQGPIDDAFMQRFLFVLPSGRCANDAVQQWVATEAEHAMNAWRRHFRGDIRSVLDTQLTEQQIAQSNLILFGDRQANSVLARLADRLPIQWTGDGISAGARQLGGGDDVLAMIYPNPLNPDRYVVLNSGFTYREYDYLNNARQTPKLPDWAVLDIQQGATTQLPGEVLAAGFFDESWQLQAEAAE